MQLSVQDELAGIEEAQDLSHYGSREQLAQGSRSNLNRESYNFSQQAKQHRNGLNMHGSVEHNNSGFPSNQILTDGNLNLRNSSSNNLHGTNSGQLSGRNISHNSSARIL